MPETYLNSEIVQKFGYWPQFCDAKIVSISLNLEEKILELLVEYADVEKKLFVRAKIIFLGLVDIELSDVMDQNIIDYLSVIQSSDGINIHLASCCGLSGKFCCQGIEVDEQYFSNIS